MRVYIDIYIYIHTYTDIYIHIYKLLETPLADGVPPLMAGVCLCSGLVYPVFVSSGIDY